MVGYILCALLVTAGLFVLTDVRPRDVTEGLRRPFEKDIGRKRRIRQVTGSMPSLRQRLMEEAVAMLDASGMGEQVATYRNMAALMAVAGFLTGLAMENILASVVLAIGLAMVPMTIIRLRAADYTRMVNEKLEMAMGSVTSSYVATGDLLTAVERVLTMLPAPVNDIFGRFVVDVQYLDGNIVRAIQRMREASENWYWKEWCGALIQCQDDVSLNRTLSGIVERFSEMRQIQLEVDTTLRKHMSDYVLTVMLVLGSIPLMGLMIPDWYDMLMHTLPGKITLAVVLATVLATSVWVSRAHVPAEGVEQR